MGNVSAKSVTKLKTRVFVFIILFFFENPTFYVKMWKNVVETVRSKMTI